MALKIGMSNQVAYKLHSLLFDLTEFYDLCEGYLTFQRNVRVHGKAFWVFVFKDTLKDVHSDIFGHDILPYFLLGMVNAFYYAYLLSVFRIL